jgi:hypothetical protein
MCEADGCTVTEHTSIESTQWKAAIYGTFSTKRPIMKCGADIGPEIFVKMT